MQTELDKKSSNTARHGAFGVGERFVKPKQPDSASVSFCMNSLTAKPSVGPHRMPIHPWVGLRAMLD